MVTSAKCSSHSICTLSREKLLGIKSQRKKSSDLLSNSPKKCLRKWILASTGPIISPSIVLRPVDGKCEEIPVVHYDLSFKFAPKMIHF